MTLLWNNLLGSSDNSAVSPLYSSVNSVMCSTALTIIVITSCGVLLAALAIHPGLVCLWPWGLCPRLSGSQAVTLLSVIANIVIIK